MNYKLKQIISVYENETLDSYIEISEIDDKDNIINTRPLAPETLSKLCSLSSKKELSTKHLLPANVIYVSFKTDIEIIAYAKAKKDRLIIKDICDKEIVYPAMLFHFKNNKLAVYTIKRYSGLNTKIYHNPFPNNISDGHICMGNIKIQNDDYVELINEYMSAFYNSTFTIEGLGEINGDMNITEFYNSVDVNTDITNLLKPLLNSNSKQMILQDLINNI